jgi:hypothetical protein
MFYNKSFPITLTTKKEKKTSFFFYKILQKAKRKILVYNINHIVVHSTIFSKQLVLFQLLGNKKTRVADTESFDICKGE